MLGDFKLSNMQWELDYDSILSSRVNGASASAIHVCDKYSSFGFNQFSNVKNVW